MHAAAPTAASAAEPAADPPPARWDGSPALDISLEPAGEHAPVDHAAPRAGRRSGRSPGHGAAPARREGAA